MSGWCEIGSGNRVWTSRLDRLEFQPRNSSGAYQRSVPRRSTRPDVRLSKADITPLNFNVCFTPESRLSAAQVTSPLWAKSGYPRENKLRKQKDRCGPQPLEQRIFPNARARRSL